ncbi:MAG: acyltransferase [Candidatus Dadabacteria bacterium]|nr:MAG: acyltransferase [Candidatus Dadabacteria bacterium]
MCRYRLEVGQMTRVREAVEVDEQLDRLAINDVLDQVRADEPGTAGNQKAHALEYNRAGRGLLKRACRERRNPSADSLERAATRSRHFPPHRRASAIGNHMSSEQTPWSQPARTDLPGGTSHSGTAKRLPEIDALRGAAIVAVVGLHSSWFFLRRVPPRTLCGEILALLHMLTGFAVPLFVALSAFGLTRRYPPTAGFFGGYGQLLAWRIWRLLPAYVLWSLVSALSRRSSVWPPSRLLALLLTGSADIHLYFIPLIFELYLLWPLVRRLALPLQARTTLWGRAIVGALLLLGSAALSFGWWHASKDHRALATTAGLVGCFFLYAVLGLVASCNYKEVQRALASNRYLTWIFAIGSAVGAAAMLCDYRATVRPPFSLFQLQIAVMIFRWSHALYTYAVIGLIFALALRWRQAAATRVFVYLGRRAYGIYLVHMLVLHHFSRRLIGLANPSLLAGHGWIVGLPLVWSFTVAASAGLTHFAARKKWTAWTVGLH